MESRKQAVGTPTITVFIPENLAPLASWFEDAVHDELSHVLGEVAYKKAWNSERARRQRECGCYRNKQCANNIAIAGG